MSNYDRLNKDGLDTLLGQLADVLENKFQEFVVVPTKAQWDAMSSAEKNDPTKSYYLPWKGTIYHSGQEYSGGGGGGGHIISTATATFPARTYLRFDGAEVTDNPTDDETIISIEGSVTPLGLRIASQPTKTTYLDTEVLDLTGVEVVLDFSDGTTRDVTENTSFSPANGSALTTSITSVTASYGGYTANIPITVKHITKFAVHYSENNSDPDSCDYPQGYDNYGWTPMYVNLSTGVPVYGSWDREGANSDLVSWLYPKSCMLLQTGTVDYYLDENDETKKADGTASDVANTSYAGNAMMEWAQDGAIIHWKIIPDQDGHGWTFVVANTADPNDPDLKPWNHWDCDGNVSPHFYTAKYNGSNINSVVRSLSGQTCYVNDNDATETTKCRANNKNGKVEWDKEVYCDRMFIELMIVLFSKSLNSQTKFGSGRCKSTNKSAINTGTMNGRGLFYGSSDQTSGVKVFGMENPWGNIWRRVMGLINVSGTVKVKMTHDTKDGSTVSDYNQTGDGYLSVGTIGGTSGGYISAMNITKYGIFPKTMSGSDNTYYCDGGWFNNGQTNVAIVGGRWDDALLGGAFSCALSIAASYTYADIGAAVSCKPLAS